MVPTLALFQDLHDHPANGDTPTVIDILDLQNKKIDRMADALSAAVGRLDRLGAAFPGGDTDGHRLYHEEVIQLTKERRAFWHKLTFELAKYGLLGFIGWLAVMAWQAFLMGPPK